MISQEDLSAIAELDLDPIKIKLMHEQSGEGWSRAKADAVEFEYRRFLYLMKTFPHEETAPLWDVDIFWHYHILDTMKYAVDCDKVFGYFLHHFPYIGLRGEEDEVAHERVGERMRELYEATFGESYTKAAQLSDEKAFSGAPGQQAVAFSGSPGKQAVAFSGSPGKQAVAFSGSPGKQAVAFSGSPGKQDVAFSGSPGRQEVAFSGAPGKQEVAFSGAPISAGAGFYAQRPTLAPSP